MHLKNYYAILGVPRNALPEEIKKTFRATAKKHHPDAAPDNPFAEAYFRELQEAYEVLSNPTKRAWYDEECWLRGLYQRAGRFVISPEWILGEARKLRRHMSAVDTYRMNHGALADYVMALLSDEHLSVLREAPELHRDILAELLPGLQGLNQRYLPEVSARLRLLAGAQEALAAEVAKWRAAKEQEARWNRYRPAIVIGFALMICLLIWLLQR